MSNFDAPPKYVPATPRRMPDLSSSDFETASIRSAAPSYLSAAPTYTSSTSPFSPTTSTRRNTAPSLSNYMTPSSSWSTTRANPTARHYHSVASRRATIATEREQAKILHATNSINPVATLMKSIEEEERDKYELQGRVRPREDEELVGREAAEQARRERLNKWGKEVLVREDRRWDWLLDQMKDWEEREKSWNKFRAEVEGGKRGNWREGWG